MSIDEYLDSLLSEGSSPTKTAIAKLTRLLENFGSIMIKSTERIEDAINELDARITALENKLGGAPGGGIKMPSAPSIGGGTPSPSIPSAPNLSSGPTSGPNLGGGGTPAPNLSGAPAPAPNLGAGPGSPGFASEIANAAKSLQKAPVQQSPAPGPGPMGGGGVGPLGGPTASAILEAKAKLKKVDPDAHKKEREEAAQVSRPLSPQQALLSEVKAAQQKRSQRMEESEEASAVSEPTPATPKKSTKQMKESLQNELRAAFSSLLNDDEEEK